MHIWTAEYSERLDTFLADISDELSRARVQRAIAEGVVTVNGKVVRKVAYKLAIGDQVVFGEEKIEPDDTLHIQPCDLQLKILYEDDDCFVLHKPAGVAVHPGTGMLPDEKTLLHGARFLHEQAELAHRLDKDTTGCILLAKNAKAHMQLQQQFAERTVQKTYLAIVADVPALHTALIDAPIGRNIVERTKMSVLQTRASREARTTYVALDAAEDVALLQCDLHTGRTHQIRVHLQSIGHPLLGDTSYGTARSEKITVAYAIDQICLHAWKLVFISPATQQQVDVCAQIPQKFTDALLATHLSVRNA